MAIPRFKPQPCPFIGQPCEYVPMANRMVELEEDIERLREALKKIVEPIGPTYPDSLIHNDLEIIEIAQAALKEGE